MEDTDYIFMQEKLPTFRLHMKKSIKQIVCNHPVATGRLYNKVHSRHLYVPMSLYSAIMFCYIYIYVCILQYYDMTIL